MKDWQHDSSKLSLADRHIRRCHELIRAQEGQVKRANALSRDAVEAERLLTILRRTADVLVIHRAVIAWTPTSSRVVQRCIRAAFARALSSQPHVSGAGAGTVLLVDDDVNTRVALETLIADAGYTVLTATNGKDAFEKAINQRPDVVVSDVMMPVMDGPALVSALASDLRLSNVPVVLSSADAAPPDLPVSAFLRKPCSPQQLLRLICSLIEEHRSSPVSARI